MCFSQYASYAPRPVKEYTTVRPAGTPPTKAEQDPNLFGAIPAPPEWRVETTPEDGHDHDHDHGHDTNTVETPAATVYAATNHGNSTPGISAITTQTVEAVVVELSNGTKLLICPL
jgi:hypothetical protein